MIELSIHVFLWPDQNIYFDLIIIKNISTEKHLNWFIHFGDQLVEWSWNVTWRMDLKVYVWCVQMKHGRVITQPCTSPQLCGAFYLLSGHLFAFYKACFKGFCSLWLSSASFLQIFSSAMYIALKQVCFFYYYFSPCVTINWYCCQMFLLCAYTCCSYRSVVCFQCISVAEISGGGGWSWSVSYIVMWTEEYCAADVEVSVKFVNIESFFYLRELLNNWRGSFSCWCNVALNVRGIPQQCV